MDVVVETGLLGEADASVVGAVLFAVGDFSFPFFFGMIVGRSDERVITSSMISVLSPLRSVPSAGV